MSLADSLENAASALPEHADAIRPANGDPFQLLDLLGPERAGRVLSWLLAEEPDAGAELCLAWLDVDGGPEVLSSIDEASLSKAGRKGLRKALHRLRSSGVSVPEKRAAAPTVARLPRIEESLDAGYVSALDPRGAHLVYLVQSNPWGGARLFEILLDASRGLVDFEVYSSGRSRIRRFVKAAVERTRFPAVEATPDSVRALVARVAARHPASRVLPSGFLEWRSKIAVEGETPGDLAARALGAESDDASLARAADLVRKGTVGPWGPPPAELSERVEERLRTAASEPAGSEDWAALAELVFAGEPAEVSAVRLREHAYVLWKLEREDEARACLAAAACFAASEGRQPVAAAMTEVLLTPVLEEMRARESQTEGEG